MLSNNTQLQDVDAITLNRWIDQKNITLIDVRESGEYASERIPGAKSVPLSTFQPEQIPDYQKLVLYCQSGNRSAHAAQQLLNAGFTDVAHLRGGLSAWKQAGYAIESTKNAPISLFRQIQIVAGSLVVLGTILGAFVSPWFLLLSGFVGSGLIFAGITNTCALGLLLAKLPYNRNAV